MDRSAKSRSEGAKREGPEVHGRQAYPTGPRIHSSQWTHGLPGARPSQRTGSREGTGARSRGGRGHVVPDGVVRGELAAVPVISSAVRREASSRRWAEVAPDALHSERRPGSTAPTGDGREARGRARRPRSATQRRRRRAASEALGPAGVGSRCGAARGPSATRSYGKNPAPVGEGRAEVATRAAEGAFRQVNAAVARLESAAAWRRATSSFAKVRWRKERNFATRHCAGTTRARWRARGKAGEGALQRR